MCHNKFEAHYSNAFGCVSSWGKKDFMDGSEERTH
jgi:hypothetical protein